MAVRISEMLYFIPREQDHYTRLWDPVFHEMGYCLAPDSKKEVYYCIWQHLTAVRYCLAFIYLFTFTFSTLRWGCARRGKKKQTLQGVYERKVSISLTYSETIQTVDSVRGSSTSHLKCCMLPLFLPIKYCIVLLHYLFREKFWLLWCFCTVISY